MGDARRVGAMGCDIHIYVEQQTDEGWERVEWPNADRENYIFGPFDWRSYGVFGFLANVRNYSEVPPLAEPRGLPDDASASLREECDDSDYHSRSWLTVDELAAFDYDETFEDRRVTVQVGPNSFDGGATAEPGGGTATTFREFLGASFIHDLDVLRGMNEARPTRVVFWFDS
jgi:hypothetical protein